MEDPKGTILFVTIGRNDYGFDVFSVNLSAPGDDELLLTDGISLNFNAQFIDDGNSDHQPPIVFISERTGSTQIFQTNPNSEPSQLQWSTQSLFVDRPIVKNGRLYFVSAHENPDSPFRSWSALYSAAAASGGGGGVRRLTPPGEVDYSPAVSRSGKFVAVASYGDRDWGGEFHEMNTDIVVFAEPDTDTRAVVCRRGGWPSWCGDSTVFFHRKAEDGWWSIFRIEIGNFSDMVSSEAQIPIRVTPAGVHCFTPAAFHDGKRVAVATRRKRSSHRQIEIFDLELGEFSPLTELRNPNLHHYNPFVSPDSNFVAYHRFRGESSSGQMKIPRLEPVVSPIKDLRMLRIAGAFPAFSPAGDYVAFNPGLGGPNGGLKVVKSDGSKEWTLIKGRTSFCNSWSPTEKHVIYTSIGPIFASTDRTVQIARVSFDPRDLDSDGGELSCDVKILTRHDTGNNAFPACSPDGKSIVFRSGRSGHKNLYLMDAINGELNGETSRQITTGSCIDTMPSWSPTGDLIAFSSNRHNPSNTETFSIYVVRPDGSGLKRIHVADKKDANRERINHVCFSKDGDWLLFTSNLAGVTAEPVSLPNQFQPYGDLYVMRLDGSGLRRLTWNGYENGTPAWYPSSDDVELGSLSLKEDEVVVGDKLTGEFDEPLWISCDI
ncbi:Tol-Pal system protein TolB [Linum perenne]